MARSWEIEGFAKRLRDAGMAADAAARTAHELSGHLLDLYDEERSCGKDDGAARSAACRRLGDPDEVFRQIIGAYRRGTFVGRHPWLFFIVVPVTAVLLGWVLTLFLIALPHLLVWDNFSVPRVIFWSPACGFLVNQCMPLLLAGGFALLARRLGQSLAWRLVPACIMAALMVWLKLSMVIILVTPHGIVSIVHGSLLSIITGCILTLGAALVGGGMVARGPSAQISLGGSRQIA